MVYCNNLIMCFAFHRDFFLKANIWIHKKFNLDQGTMFEVFFFVFYLPLFMLCKLEETISISNKMDLGHDLKFGKFKELNNMHLCFEFKWKLLHVNLIGFLKMFS
jgi:hypothetical protein